MKTRTDRELLIILRDNIDLLVTGLCSVNNILLKEKFISFEEWGKLDMFIKTHIPHNRFYIKNYPYNHYYSEIGEKKS